MSENKVTIEIVGDDAFICKIAMALLQVSDDVKEQTFCELEGADINKPLSGGENEPGEATGLNLTEAIALAAQGFRVRRPMWKDGVYLFVPEETRDGTPNNLSFMYESGQIGTVGLHVLLSKCETEAQDWEVLS